MVEPEKFEQISFMEAFCRVMLECFPQGLPEELVTKEIERSREWANKAHTSSKYFRGLQQGFNDCVSDFRDLQAADKKTVLKRLASIDLTYKDYLQQKLYPEKQFIERGEIISDDEFRIAKDVLELAENENFQSTLVKMIDDYEFKSDR